MATNNNLGNNTDAGGNDTVTDISGNTLPNSADTLRPAQQAMLATLMPAMDNNNRAAAQVMATQGLSAAAQFMFTDQETGRQLSYAEMRARYG